MKTADEDKMLNVNLLTVKSALPARARGFKAFKSFF